MEVKSISERREIMITIAKSICDKQKINYKNGKLDFPANGDIPAFTAFFDNKGNVTSITE